MKQHLGIFFPEAFSFYGRYIQQRFFVFIIIFTLSPYFLQLFFVNFFFYSPPILFCGRYVIIFIIKLWSFIYLLLEYIWVQVLLNHLIFIKRFPSSQIRLRWELTETQLLKYVVNCSYLNRTNLWIGQLECKQFKVLSMPIVRNLMNEKITFIQFLLWKC